MRPTNDIRIQIELAGDGRQTKNRLIVLVTCFYSLFGPDTVSATQ